MGVRNIAVVTLLLLTSLLSSACGGGSGNQPASPNFAKLTPTCFAASASNPILTGDSQFTGSDWNDPSVIKVGNQYVMYASSDHSLDLNIAIYRMVSNDGLSWPLSPATPVLQADANAAAWDHRAVETPSVVYFNGQYHMFYTGYPLTYADSTSYRIGHATSPDGITWTRDANNPIVAPTDPTVTTPLWKFNQAVTAEPAAVVFNNKIYLYYSAVGTNTTNGNIQVIGLVTSSDGTNWSAQQEILRPDQTLYPTASWFGYSTPAAVVLNGKMHLFYDVAQVSPWKQRKIHHAISGDGITVWTEDSAVIYSNTDFAWTADEIRSPSVLLDGTSLYMWFAGSTATPTFSIGRSTCAL
jgi:sucrose-6-phosphate hydrolase SacC (GH32 family)